MHVVHKILPDTRSRLIAILLFAFLVRLPNIDAPIIGAHSWRQADTAAMARNFVELNQNVLFPRVDWGGGAEVESEFPLFQWTISLFYSVFGVHEVFGRLLSLASSLVTLFFFFLIVKKMSDEETALWSTLILAILPLEVFYSRAFMPDITMMMFTVIGIHQFILWQENRSTFAFVVSCLSITLACLLKITSLYIGILLLFLSWRQLRFRFLLSLPHWLYAFTVIVIVSLWYFHAHQIYVNGGVTFGIWEYGTDKWGNWQMLLQLQFWNRILFQSIAERHLTWVGFFLFIAGLLSRSRHSEDTLIYFWLLSVLFYFVVVAKGNFVHEYYQLPILPPAAYFMGKAFVSSVPRPLWKRILLACSFASILCLGSVRLASYFAYEKTSTSKEYRVAQAISRNSNSTDLIYLLDYHDPTILYLSHRKGWEMSWIEFQNDALNLTRQPSPHLFAGYFAGLDEAQRIALNAFLRTTDSVAIAGDYFLVRVRSQQAF